MSKSNWKDIAEFTGMVAIVLSLIFVGLQMKQSQEIAIAETYQQEIEAAYASGALAACNSEAVDKANNGDELSGAERFALQEYVRARWVHGFFSQSHQMFLSRNTGGPITFTSIFFCENPGLIKIMKTQFSYVAKDSIASSRLGAFTSDLDAAIEDRCGE